jgi:hypothetical protein
MAAVLADKEIDYQTIEIFLAWEGFPTILVGNLLLVLYSFSMYVLGHICVSIVRGQCPTSMMCISITIKY